MFSVEKLNLLGKMEKLSKEPYLNKNVVDAYEDRYIHHPKVSKEISFEISLVEANVINKQSWCDVACGTGYHLRKAKGTFSRTGLDRSDMMMSKHKKDTVHKVDYILADILEYTPDNQYDLVSNFWFGYSHQETLAQVLQFFNKMIDLTKQGGSVLISYHNQWNIFDKIPLRTKEPMGGIFNFEAMVWSYSEPEIPDSTYKCIVPHKELIVETFKPYFKSYEIVQYPHNPQAGGKEMLLLKGKH